MASLNQPLWNISGLQIFLTCKSDDDFKFSKYGDTSTLKYSSYFSFSVKNKERKSIVCSFSIPNFFKIKSSMASFCLQIRKISAECEDLEDYNDFDPTEGFVSRSKQILGCGNGVIQFSSFIEENTSGIEGVRVNITINSDTKNTVTITGEQMLAIEEIVSNFSIPVSSMLLINSFLSQNNYKSHSRKSSAMELEEVEL